MQRRLGACLGVWLLAGCRAGSHPSTVQIFRAGHAPREFVSVGAARDALRAERQSLSGGFGDAVVELGPGVHAPFELDERDSGSPGARVTYRASAAGGAVVSGGVAVPPHLCTERKATPTDEVIVCDLSSLQLNKTTTLGFRPLAVSFSGAPAILARYPNIANGSVWNGTYQWLIADSGGNSTFGLSATNPDAKRVASWAEVPGSVIQGYFVFDWADRFTPITGGGAGSDGSATLQVGGGSVGAIKPLARFIGMNMLIELDAVHEFFIDAEQEKLYFYPPTPLAEWGATQLVISRNETAITLTGVSHHTVEGLTVVAAAGNGITATEVNSTVIKGCTVAANGKTGIQLSGYNSGVENCALCSLSANSPQRAWLAPLTSASYCELVAQCFMQVRFEGWEALACTWAGATSPR